MQKAIIILSNSLHLLKSMQIQNTLNITCRLKLKISFLTFNHYPKLSFSNTIYLPGYKALKSIIDLLYKS